MSFTFQPKSEEELAAEKVLPVGEYDFEVFRVLQTVSKKSKNDMLKITLRVFGPERTILVDHYIVNNQEDKLLNFLSCIGKQDNYYRGELEESDLQGFCGLGGKLKLKIDEQEDFNPKNAVARFLVAKAAKPEPTGTGKTARQLVSEVQKRAENGDLTENEPF